MKRAVYAGEFDPVTLWHMDIIRRAARLAQEQLILGVLDLPDKTFLLPLKQRLEQLKASTVDMPNVKIQVCSIGMVYFARANRAEAIIRGVRSIADFEYELHRSQMNRKIEPDIETIFLSSNLDYSFLDSGVVRELAAYKKDVSQFVPRPVAEEFTKMFNNSI